MENKALEITLRPDRLSDAEDFFKAGDEKVTKFTRWNTFTSEEQALSYIKEFCIPHPYCRSICINDRSSGFIFVKPQDGDGAEVGYALAAEYWGQGIVTRAVKMTIKDGFEEFSDLVRMQALVLIENKASQRVLEKVGFQNEVP